MVRGEGDKESGFIGRKEMALIWGLLVDGKGSRKTNQVDNQSAFF